MSNTMSTEKGLRSDEKVENISQHAERDEMKNTQAFKGDNSDGKINWTIRNAIAAVTLGGLYTGKYPTSPHHGDDCLTTTGSQVMLYFVGGSLSYIVEDLGATTNGSWLPVANTLAITAVAPFVGKFLVKDLLCDMIY